MITSDSLYGQAYTDLHHPHEIIITNVVLYNIKYFIISRSESGSGGDI